MTCVEVEASPLRIKGVDHRGHVPNLCSDVLFMIVVTRLDSILFAERDQAAELTGCLFEFSPHVDHLLLLLTRPEEWHRNLGRCPQAYPPCPAVRPPHLRRPP